MTPNEKAAQLIVDYQLINKDSSYDEALNASVRVCDDILDSFIDNNDAKWSGENIDYWSEVRSIVLRNYQDKT